jgi:hypothetical protein
MLLANREEKIFWTKHSKAKMRQYRFSEKRVLNILRKPDRREVGIAPKTIAAMQASGTKKHPGEVWMMYSYMNKASEGHKSRILSIISAWRYPGRTPLGQHPIIPEDTLEELEFIKHSKI